MIDTRELESPFRTPAADDDATIRELIGESTFELTQRITPLNYALLIQLGSWGGLIVLAGIARFQIDQEHFAMLFPAICLGIVVLIYAYGMWCLFRVSAPLQWPWHQTLLICGLGMIPLLGTIVLWQVTNNLRTMLTLAGVPFKEVWPDWKQLHRIAAEREELAGRDSLAAIPLSEWYHLVFCDNVDEVTKIEHSANPIPWIAVPSSLDDPAKLKATVTGRTADSRSRILAARQLLSISDEEVPEEILGIVFEATHKEGMYVVAIYSDGGLVSLRGQSEFRVLPPGSEGLSAQVQDVFDQVLKVRESFAPHYLARPRRPSLSEARITLLTAQGTRLSQASWKLFYKHPATRIVADAAVILVDQLYGFDPPRKDPESDLLTGQSTDIPQIWPAVYQHRASVQMAIVINTVATLATLLSGFIVVAIFYFGVILFCSYAVYRLMKSIGETSRGIIYAILQLVPVVNIFVLGLAHYHSDRLLQQNSRRDDV